MKFSRFRDSTLDEAASIKDIEKLMKELNDSIDRAIKNKDKKTLDELSKDLKQILDDLYYDGKISRIR